jgi:hypothetical protein
MVSKIWTKDKYGDLHNVKMIHKMGKHKQLQEEGKSSIIKGKRGREKEK